MSAPGVDVQAAQPLQLNPQLSGLRQVGAGGVGVSPLGGLAQAVQGSHRRQLGLMDDQANLTGELGQAQAGGMHLRADREEADAETKAQLAAQQAQDEAEATEKTKAVVAYQQKMVDDLATRKVDPGRLYRNMDTATRITTALGAVAAGMLQGLQGGTNQVIDRLDRLAEEDIKSQLQEIDNQKSSIQGRQSLVNQMIQLTGDRRAGAMAAKSILFDAMAQSAKGFAERTKIPEHMKNADLLVNAIQQHKEVTTGTWAQQAYEAALRQAQAAAAARLAEQKRLEEQRRWELEYRLKQQDADAKMLEAVGKGTDDINKQTQSLGKELGEKDLADGRAAVDAAKRRLLAARPNEGLPGVGRGADLRERIARRPEGLNMLNPTAWALNATAGLSDQELVSRGDWEKIKLAYQKQITGSGASTEERAMLSKAFEGAKTPAEQRNAIMEADDFFSRREAAIKAGYDPRVVKVFEDRRDAIKPQLPATVQVKK